MPSKDKNKAISIASSVECLASQILNRHARTLSVKLRGRAQKHGMDLHLPYTKRVIVLYYKTYLGTQRDFWDVLFTEAHPRLASHNPHLTKERRDDIIVEAGYRAVHALQKKLPSHAGKFHFPLPDLFPQREKA